MKNLGHSLQEIHTLINLKDMHTQNTSAGRFDRYSITYLYKIENFVIFFSYYF